MDDVINLYKPVGATPLETLESLRKGLPELQEESLTYAGRLDPIADGVLLILKSDAIKNKQEFLDLDKTYRAKILLGFTSDSLDILGVAKPVSNKKIELKDIELEIQKLVGENSFEVPIYSSIPVQGKSLLNWARENKISEIEVPKRVFKISEISLINLSEINSEKLLNKIDEIITTVRGDFRQKEIRATWDKLLGEHAYFQQVEIEVKCESGTYIRSLANELGRNLKSGGVILALTRTAVGSYKLSDSIRVE